MAKKQQSLRLMGRKRGMMQIFTETGEAVPCTIIEVEPNVITQIKTVESDGYNAIQLGFEKITVKDPRTINNRTKKPQRGHFAKAEVEPRKHLAESRVEDVANYQIGQELGISSLGEIEYIDATAVSKGKGYQGVIKLHNFAGGPAAHGSGFHRHHGSTGMRSTPGRILPGGKAASQMGNRKVTTQNLKIVMVQENDNLLIVQGNVPGPKGGLVYVTKSKKKHAA